MLKKLLFSTATLLKRNPPTSLLPNIIPTQKQLYHPTFCTKKDLAVSDVPP